MSTFGAVFCFVYVPLALITIRLVYVRERHVNPTDDDKILAVVAGILWPLVVIALVIYGLCMAIGAVLFRETRADRERRLEDAEKRAHDAIEEGKRL